MPIGQYNISSYSFFRQPKQLMVAIDFHSSSIVIFPILCKSMATINIMVTNIFQNIFFCVQQKKEPHTCLEKVNDDNILIFG